jgi:hypothetical protein
LVLDGPRRQKLDKAISTNLFKTKQILKISITHSW